MIELRNLSIGHGRHVLFRGLNGRAESGRLTCLLGRNGMGKSTLLQTIASFLPALEGEVKVDGHAVGGMSPMERARLMSVVLTSRPDDLNITVSGLVGLGRSPYTDFWGRLREEDRKAVDEALRMVGITQLARRNFGKLSDGERQKAMLARALAQQTPVILLDEPTAFLDHPAKTETLRLLGRIAHELGKTILLSTHDVEIALREADDIWVLTPAAGLSCGAWEEMERSEVLKEVI